MKLGSSSWPRRGTTTNPAAAMRPGHGERRDRVAHDRLQEPPVAGLEPTHERALGATQLGPAEQDHRQGRGQDQRDHQRDQHGQRVGERQRTEERAGQALEEEHRQEGQRLDERRVHDRAPDLERRLQDDRRLRLLAPLRGGQAESSHDVLDVDDGVVDDGAERDHEARQHHRVDGGAAGVEHQPGRDQRHRDGDDADQRAAPVEQEQRQDDHDQHRAEHQRLAEVVQRLLHEGRRPEDRRVDVEAGEPGPHLVDGVLDALRDVERVPPRELLDDHHETRAAVDDRVADERLVVLHDAGDVADADGLATALGHDDLGQLGGLEHRQDVVDVEPLVGGVDEAALADDRAARVLEDARVEGVAGRLHDLVERDALRLQQLRRHLDDLHVDALAPDHRVGHAGHPQQAGPDLPVRGHRLVDHRDVLRRDADLHHPAGRRERLQHDRRRGPRRQVRRHALQPLLHELPGADQVRARIEDELDLRELADRLRAEHVERRDAGQRLLEGHGDQGLGLLRREPEGDGLDLDLRRRELGEHVDRHVPQLRDAEQHHRPAEGDDEEAEPDARRDDPAHHRTRAPRCWISVHGWTVTSRRRTRSPTARPRRR